MMWVKCPKCNYPWNYRGKRDRAKCPYCSHTFKVSEHIIHETGISRERFEMLLKILEGVMKAEPREKECDDE